jgi:hypothetical protein
MRKTTEITPEMIQAGWQMLAASGISDDPLEADKLWVERIHRAMFALRPQASEARDRTSRNRTC